ncbi:MAG: SDR family oxidoreductase [Candidatus Hodarchaeales archaeon]|jgi:NAD(P)-dependent dehydrogenase (short-subunit alcohol dehydrogenase family)
MKNVLITGGSRGLGLEFTKQYLNKGFHVFAASRNPGNSPELNKMKKKFSNLLSIYPLDVSNEISRNKLYQRIAADVEKIDVLINNAGVASGNEKLRYRFGELKQEDLSRCFLVNTIAPLMLTEKLLPLIEKGTKPVVVNISSNSGSIAKKKGNGSTGYGYSSSKAALNMISKMLSNEMIKYGIIVVTTMLYTDKAPLEPFESITGMIRVIESLEMEDSGKFLDWQGNEIPF